MNALQALPIPEPYNLISRNTILPAEFLLNEYFDELLRRWSHITGIIFLQEEFRPNNQVFDVRIKSVGPVVVEDPIVVDIGEWKVARRCQAVPVKSFLLNKCMNSAILPRQVVDVFAVPS